MSTYLGDPTAEKYILYMKQKQRQNESAHALLMLLYKLGVYPSVHYQGKTYPMSRKHPSFKDFYQSKRRQHGCR